jgi:hypothetical protein
MNYETARIEFDKIAAYVGPASDLRRTRGAQVKLSRAHIARWGASSDLEHVAVLAEEAGEYDEQLYFAVEPQMRLELGDTLVAMAMLATSHRLDFATLIESASAAATFDPDVTIALGVGLVARAVVKARRSLRGLGEVGAARLAMFNALHDLAVVLKRSALQWDLDDIFVEAVERVTARWSAER